MASQSDPSRCGFGQSETRDGTVWGGWSLSTSISVAPYVYMARICSDPIKSEIEVQRLSVKILPTPVMVGGYGVADVISLGNQHCRLCYHAWDASRETLVLGHPHQRMTDLRCRAPSWGIVLEEVRARGDKRWSGVASSASKTTDQGCLVQWGLNVGCVLMSAQKGGTV